MTPFCGIRFHFFTSAAGTAAARAAASGLGAAGATAAAVSLQQGPRQLAGTDPDD
jgi:hypothetical protein